jgi:hypothetical protein
LYFHGLKGRDHSSVVFADAYKNAKYLTETDVLSRLKFISGFMLTRIRWNFLAVIFSIFETPNF